ncbi:MAG TPA: CHAT domain-containing protein [Pseudonocardiaceae bacterium]|nr:CHAT domain-containing protein [Pseudonocardiaceae bacterium]
MTAEPEDTDRLELAERLVTEYEAGNGTTDDLIAACEHAEAITDGPRWVGSRTVLAVAYEYLAFETGVPLYFDRAVDAADELARWIPEPSVLVDAARVRLFRYYQLPGAVPERFPSLESAADHLEHALAIVSSDEDRIGAETILGLVTAERALAYEPDAVTAARAIELLTRSLDFLELTDFPREMVLRTLADTHLLRYCTEGMRGSADRDDDLDIAIEKYTEAVQDYGTDLAPDLIGALMMRLSDRPTAEDREEAIHLLESVVDCTDPSTLDLEQAEQLGELLNHRAEDDGTAESANAAVLFLERAIDAVGPISGSLNTLLLTAYGRPGQITVSRLNRAIELIDETVRNEPDSDTGVLRWVRALAFADRTHRLALPADRALARQALTEALSGTADFDWNHLALLSSLAVLIAVEQGTAAPQGWSPYRMGDSFPSEQRVLVRAWLEDHQPPGSPDYVATIALLRADEVPHEPAARDVRVAGLRVSVPALAAAVGAGDSRIQLLVRRKYGEQLGELGRLTDSLPDVRKAAVLLDELLGDLPTGHPLRAGTLGYFANNVFSGRLLDTVGVDYANARSALTDAIDDPTVLPPLRAAFLLILCSIETDTQVYGDRDFALALHYAQRAVLELADDDPNHAAARYQLAGLLLVRFGFDGAIEDAVAARQHLRVILDQFRRGIATPLPTEHDVLRILHQVELQITLRSGSAAEKLAAAEAAIAAVPSLVDRADATQDERYDAAFTRGLALLFRAEQTQRREDLRAAIHELISSADLAPLYLQQGVAPSVRGAMMAHLGCLELDQDQFERGVGILDELAATDTADYRDRASAARFAALARSRWSEVTDDPAALDVAIENLEASDAMLTEGLEFRNAARMYALSAELYWRRGRPADIQRAVQRELDSLRERGRDVVLQTSSDDALAIVTDAADSSARLAARCLDLGLRTDAVRAIEAGRGLVMQAAMTTENIPVLLREHGHGALAAEWEREEHRSGSFGLPGTFGGHEIPRVVPSNLRTRVLLALASTDSIQALLNIPTVHEIEAALRVLAADAAVYLLPPSGDGPGRALVVSADGEVGDVTLSGLRDANLGPLRDYVAARAAAEDANVPPDRRAELAAVWRGALDRLCDWAGRTVLDPLRSHLSGLGAAPHVVLVPSGLLSVVPWHAARTESRYAVSDFVFSSASSARQLCVLAARRHRPLAGSPVVVADPTGTLACAPVEARYVADCYPGTRRLDTQEEVLAALRTGATTMAHFGCHAVSGPTPSTSYLRLAGHVELTVATIMEQRHSGTAGGLVVLAACQSGLTQTAHDEGLTLANAFVAAGATGVTGALWAVPDDASSVLMCLYHHELGRPGRRPVDALRAVQLWALGSDRAVPEDFPTELLRYVSDVDFRQPAIWAAFTHTGW